MRFRFTTSIGGVGFHFTEGVVIEPTQMDPHVQRWLDAGILESIPSEREIPALERAVSLRRRGRRVRKGSKAVA